MSDKPHLVEVEDEKTVTTRCYILFERFQGNLFGCIAVDVVCAAEDQDKIDFDQVILERKAEWQKEAGGKTGAIIYSERDFKTGAKDYDALVDGLNKNVAKIVTIISRRPS